MRLQNPSSNEGVRQREETKEDITGSENLELSLALGRLRVYENNIYIYNSMISAQRQSNNSLKLLISKELACQASQQEKEETDLTPISRFQAGRSCYNTKGESTSKRLNNSTSTSSSLPACSGIGSAPLQTVAYYENPGILMIVQSVDSDDTKLSLAVGSSSAIGI